MIARGQKRVELAAPEVELDDLKGRSGKFRAPLLVAGDMMLVGFNESVFSEF